MPSNLSNRCHHNGWRFPRFYTGAVASFFFIASAFAQTTPSCVPAPAGIIGWWPAEGNADDIVGTNNGTLENGVTFAPGEVGQAFSFNGDYQYVQIPDSPSLHPVSLTLECWFNASNSIGSGGSANLMSKPVGLLYHDSFAFWLGSGSINGAVGSSPTEGSFATHAFTLTPGVWYHAAYTFDSDSQTQTIYVNGAVVATGAANVQIGYDSHPVLFGCDNDYGSFDQPFNGMIAHPSIYDRALSSNEIAAIYAAGSAGKCESPLIVAQPQSQSVAVGGTASFLVTTAGAPPQTFQWSFDGTNIAGATNATLVLTNVSFGVAGSYALAVTNALGSASSSDAVLTVGNSPLVTVQPLSQEVFQGADVTFIASATGTGPLGFQWSLDGAALDEATNSALSLTNVQSANAGGYAVTVSSPFGMAISSNAILTVDLLPVLETQPQTQAVIDGSNVTLSAAIAGFASPSLPAVSSGALQLWLKADAGVIANASGRVSVWQDQSTNGNDALQASTNEQPLLVYPPAIGGRAALRFNGIEDGVNGDYLHGTGNVGVPNAMTAFAVYNAFNTANSFNSVWLIGVPGTVYGASRGYTIYHGDVDFTTWAYDSLTPWAVPTNTYRICTDRVNTNLSEVQIFDNSASDATNFSESMSGASSPAAGYYIGGLNTALPYVTPVNLDGDIAEVVIYSGYLSDADRLAVLGYLQARYYVSGVTNGFSFQWQFDGTNIAGATNATLTLSDVQATNAGTYSVIVTNAAGSTTSSNAVLSLLYPPAITSSPVSQSVVAGTTVMFSAAATGTAPLSHQWQFDGTNIAGATNTSLAIASAVAANSGSYTMVASNLYGSARSLAATLSVAESTIQVASTSAAGGATVVVSIDLLALGTESGVGLSLHFDPAILTYTGTVLGSGATGGTLLVNSNEAALGSLALGVAMFNGTFAAGTNDVFDVSFQVAAVTNRAIASLTFGDGATGEQVSDPLAQTLPAVFLPGAVFISPTALAGDVSPRPNGNEAVNINDWIQEGRFAAALDIVSNGSEYQRADCAPRGAPAGGSITVADWVQVGRYAVGLDPPTAAAGPTIPGSQIRDSRLPGKDELSHPVMLVPLSQGTAMNSVGVELLAQGDESALQFSVVFNPALVRFVNATNGTGAAGAALIQNTDFAASGNVGFVVGLFSPATFAAGTQELVKLNFAPVSYSNTTALAFGSTPIQCQLVDSNAAVLSANYQDTALTVGGLSWPALSINQAGSNVVLSWPSSAAVFELQASSSLGGGWTNVVATPETIGGSLVLTSPLSTNTVYYRLKH